MDDRLIEVQKEVARKCCEMYESLYRLLGNLPLVEVKQSTKDGLGVFAIEDIKKGTIITYYPCHYFIASTYDAKGELHQHLVNGLCKEQQTEASVKSMMKDYSIAFSAIKGHTILTFHEFFVGDPKVHDFVGHMINDSIDLKEMKKAARDLMLNKFEDRFIQKFESKYDELKCSNVDCRGSPLDINTYCLPIRATRDIKAGEELFLNYGYEYWIAHMTSRQYNQKMRKWIKCIR